MSIVFEYFARLALERARDESGTARLLLGEFYPYRRQLVIIFVLNVLGACAQAGAPWLISQAINRDILRGDPMGLAQTMLILLAVYGGETLAMRGQMRLVTTIGQNVLASLRARLFDQYLHLPISYFNRRPVGDLMSRVINDVATLDSLLSQSMAFLPSTLFSLLGTLIAMLVLNTRLALASFIVIPLMVLTTSYFGREARKAFRTARETTGDVTAKLQEGIIGVREAQAFNRIETNIKRFRERIVANRNANVQAVGITSAFTPTFDLLSTLGTAIVVGYGAYLVNQDALTVGLLAGFLIYVQRFYHPIQLLSQVHTQIQWSIAGAERIYAVLDEQREPNDPPGATKLERIRGWIEFEKVSFAYEAGHPVLRDVSFRVEPGQKVALVGRTGAGKTTIANLIPRFYDATEGTVRIDGHDVREVNRKSLRKQIAIVLQEPFLFCGTVEENIGYGRVGATREDVERAARMVGAHAFIEALPKGYDTPLGERARTLSQGQRKLLSIARAVLADPRILILDEATSTIDTCTEAMIEDALASLLKGRTSMVIAHRLSTIRNADLILVIESGRIIERGTHEALLAQGGLYADLYRRQFRDPVAASSSAA